MSRDGAGVAFRIIKSRPASQNRHHFPVRFCYTFYQRNKWCHKNKITVQAGKYR